MKDEGRGGFSRGDEEEGQALQKRIRLFRCDPLGVGNMISHLSGGVAALSPRLMAANPPGSRNDAQKKPEGY